jgi:hypothetical protein
MCKAPIHIHRHGNHCPRRGYVLLMVLFVLALAAAAMAGVCRWSLQKAVIASRAEAELRRRWAVVSCRAVLLPKAEAVLTHNDNSTSDFRCAIRLGGQSFTLIFGDEQAKANVNLLYAQGGLADAERHVRTIVGISGGGVPVELRPIPGQGKSFGSPDAADDDPPAFESFDQVLGRTPPDLLVAAHGTTPSLASKLTCWGDGSMNVRRASKEVVRAVLARYLAAGEISRFLDARRKDPKAEITDMLQGLNLSDKRREPVEFLLTDDCNCHSLWIISDAGDRIRYDLGIAEGGMITMFSW